MLDLFLHKTHTNAKSLSGTGLPQSVKKIWKMKNVVGLTGNFGFVLGNLER